MTSHPPQSPPRPMTDEEWDAIFDTTSVPQKPAIASLERTPTQLSEAPPACSVTSDKEEKELLSSAVAPLPRTVPALVKAYEQLYVQCEEMRAVLDSLRVQANHLVSISPSAGAALSEVLHIVADGDTALTVAPDGTLLSTSPKPAHANEASTTPAKRAPASAQPSPSASPPSPAPNASPAATTSGGGTVVVRGRVVATATAGTGAVPSGAVADDSDTLSRLSRFVGDFKRDYKEECAVLRTQMMAMEASQQLLSHARMQLQQTQSGRREQQLELEQVQAELTEARAMAARLLQQQQQQQQHGGADDGAGGKSCGAATTDGPSPHASLEAELSRAQRTVDELRAHVAHLTSSRDAALYEQVQLEKSLRASEKTAAFLQEKNTQMEGQLQRLLTAPPQQQQQQQQQPARPTPPPSAVLPSSQPTHPSSAAPSPGARNAAPAGGISADAYNRAASEKQIHELRALVEKLHRRAEANTEKRKRLESTVAALTAENTDLKSSVLQYRRQVNESELELEREASAKAVEERAKNLEKEVLRLREAHRERRDTFEAKKGELTRALHATRAENKVYRTATRHLQKELLRCQLCLVAVEQRREEGTGSEANHQRSSTVTPNSKRHDDDAHRGADTALAEGKTSGVLPSSDEGGSAIPSSTPATLRDGHGTAVGAVPPRAEAHGVSNMSITSDGAVGSPTLRHNREALEEMRQLYERRMETLEAQKRAEVRQVQNLNRELRQALASSQEELEEKSRLLEYARTHGSHAMGGGGGSSGRTTPAWTRHPSVQASAPIRLEVSYGSGGKHPDQGALTPAARSVEIGSRGEMGASSGAVHQRLFSTDSWPVPCGGGGASTDGNATQTLVEIEQRYDPENMSVWEAVQVENEALLRRVSALQEEKWSADSVIEDMHRQNAVLTREVERNAATMNQLLQAGVLSPAALQKGQEEGRIRSLQCLLQDTLSQKFALEEQVSQLTDQLQRFR